MLHTTIKWTLFLAMCLSVPLLYLMIVIGGILTYAHIIVLTVTNPSLFAFNVIYLIVYGATLYFIASRLANRIARLKQHVMVAVMFGFFFLFLGIGSLPIYGVSHGTPNPTNAYKLLFSRGLR